MKNHTNINHKAKIKKMQLSFSFDLTNNLNIDDEIFPKYFSILIYKYSFNSLIFFIIRSDSFNSPPKENP